MKRSFFVLAILFALVAVTTPMPVWADSEYDTALQYYYKGRYEEAVKYLKEYVERKPDPSAYYLIGYSLYELGRYKEANQYFEEAYLVDPNFSPEKSGLTEKFPKGYRGGIKKPSAVHKGRAVVKKKKKVAGALTKQGGKEEAKKEVKQAPSAKQPPKETQPKKAGKPEAAAGKTTPQPGGKKVAPESSPGKPLTQTQKSDLQS